MQHGALVASQRPRARMIRQAREMTTFVPTDIEGGSGISSRLGTRSLPGSGVGSTTEDPLVLMPGVSLAPPEFLMLVWPGLGEVFSVVVVSGAAPGVGVTF